jgi:Luciferase-like monooxygenase
MGNRSQNFYNAAFERQGYGDDVRAVQDLWLAGERERAADRVPLDLGRRTNLLGPPDLVRERIARYRAVGVTTLQAKLTGPLDERLTTLATLLDLCAAPAGQGS